MEGGEGMASDWFFGHRSAIEHIIINFKFKGYSAENNLLLEKL